MHRYVISSHWPHKFIQFLQPVKKLKIEKQKRKNNPVADEVQVLFFYTYVLQGLHQSPDHTKVSASQQLLCCVLSRRVCDSYPPLRCFYISSFSGLPWHSATSLHGLLTPEDRERSSSMKDYPNPGQSAPYSYHSHTLFDGLIPSQSLEVLILKNYFNLLCWNAHVHFSPQRT